MTLTKKQKLVIQALCRYPRSFDSEISRKTGINPNTVTSYRRNMLKAGIFKRRNIPAYQAFGLPLASFHWLEDRPYVLPKDIRGSPGEGNVVTMVLRDPLTCLVMAHHRDYSSYHTFHARFEHHGPVWQSFLNTLDGALSAVNFDHGRLVQKVFSSKGSHPHRPVKVRVGDRVYLSRKLYKRIFRALLSDPEMNPQDLGPKLGTTRQTVTQFKERVLKKGLLKRATFVDPHHLGLEVLGAVIIRGPPPSKKDMTRMVRTLGPFYYWVWDDVSVLITGHVSYHALMKELAFMADLVEGTMNVLRFDVNGLELEYDFRIS